MPAIKFSQLSTLNTLQSGTILPVVYNGTNYKLTVDLLKGYVTPVWSEVRNKPVFAEIAFSGDYAVLVNKPTIPTRVSQLQIDVDLGDTAVWANIVGKPTFATVATSGSYADLINKPNLAVYVTATGLTSILSSYTTQTYVTSQGYITTSSLTWNNITGKPAFATVSTSGSYTHLTNTPVLATVATSGRYSDLSDKPLNLSNFNNDISAGGGFATTSTLVNGTYTVSLSSTGVLTLPNSGELRPSTAAYDSALAGWEFIRGGEIAYRIASGQALVQYYPMVNWYPTGATAQGYIDFLLNARTLQNTPGATLIIQPAMSTAFYNEMRAALIAIRDSDNPSTKSVSLSSAYGKSWNFGADGKLTLPTPAPITFTANLVPVLHSGGGGEAWYYTVVFQPNANGDVETMIVDYGTVWDHNPGYESGDSWNFTETGSPGLPGHGIPGYTFTLTLASVNDLGDGEWTADFAVSQGPAYPSTVKSTATIKLSADTKNWTFGTDGKLTLPDGQSIGSGPLDGIKLTTDRGTVLFGNTPECVPTQASHFHIMRDDPTTVDLFFGDDFNYVKLPYDSTLTNVGVQIGTDATNLWTFGKDGTTVFPNNKISQVLDSNLSVQTSKTVTANQIIVNGSEFETDQTVDGFGVIDGWYQRNSQQIEVNLFVAPAPVYALLTGLTLGRTVVVTYSTASGNQTFDSVLSQLFTATGQYDQFSRPRYSGRIDGTLPAGQTGIVSIDFPEFSTAENVWSFDVDGTLTLPSGNTRIGNVFGTDGMLGNTGTGVGVASQGQGGYAALQWIDDPEDATYVAAIVVNSPIASTSGTVQIATGVVAGPTAENVWEFGADGYTQFPGGGFIGHDSTGTTPAYNGTMIGAALGDDFNIQTIGGLWKFGGDGTTTFPDGTTSTGAVIRPAQSSSYIIQTLGSANASPSNYLSTFEFGLGALTLPGNIIAQTGNSLAMVTESLVNISIETPGTGYPINGGSFATTAYTGTGTGMTIQVYSPGGSLVAVSINNPGSGYQDGDVLNVLGGTGRVTVGIPYSVWRFDTDGDLILPQGSTISETNTTTIISPPGASAGQSLVIRPTGSIETNHIHLISGNPNTVDLFLGDDSQFVKVDHSGTVVVQTYSITTTTYSGSYATYDPVNGQIQIDNLIGSENVESGWTITVQPDNITSTVTTVSRYPNNIIQVSWDGLPVTYFGTYTLTGPATTDNTWTFGTDGVLTLPNGITIDSYGTSGVNAFVNIGGDNTRISIDNDGAPPGFSITTNAAVTARTWRFGPDGELTLPNGATIVDTTSTLVLTPNSPGQATSLVLRSTYNSYMTADYPTNQGYEQYLHQLDPITWPDPYVSTGTEGTVISITLWDANGLQYVQGDVEYIITGTGITAADFTPAVLTGTFASANWTLDGGSFNYTNTNMLMIANDAIVEGQETFTITIITTGTYGSYNGSNYLRVNIADGTTEGSESGHIHLISENMAQTSIFLGNDDKYVKVAADDQIYINVPNADTSGTSQLWTFGTDGTLTLPLGGVIGTAFGDNAPNLIGTEDLYAELLSYDKKSGVWVSDQTYSNPVGGGVGIATNSDPVTGEPGNQWSFGTDGSLTFPDSTVQTTAYPGSTSTLVNGTYTVALSTTGQLNLPGAANSESNNARIQSTNSIDILSNLSIWTFGTDGKLTFPNGPKISIPSGTPRTGAIAITSSTELLIGTNTTTTNNLWTFGIDGSTILPENTLKGYCFTATNSVFNYLPQSAQFLYTDSPILGLISTIGGSWYIKGPGLVGWKPVTAVQDNSGVALIVRIGSGAGPMGDGSEFHSGGHLPTSPDLVYTISQYLEFDLKASDKTWTFSENGSITFPDSTVQTTAYAITGTIPTSSTSTGITGQIATTGTDIYICVATNSWLKVTGSTF